MFYSSHQVLSYKRLFNLILDLRGIGKTYEYTSKCIEAGLSSKKKSFVVLVRYKEDLKTIKDDWWVIVEHKYPKYLFFSKGRLIYAQNKDTGEKFVIGEYVALNEYLRVKKTPRPYVKWIIFDEFLNEECRYLSNEINIFLNVIDSIGRNRDDVRVILISNTISIINPYFDFFGFYKVEQKYTKGQHNSILEFCGNSEEFKEYRKKTKFGSSIEGTSYGGFSLEGKFMLDDITNVISSPKGNKHILHNLMLNGKLISVGMINNLLYFENSTDTTRITYTPYVDDAKSNLAIYVNKNFKIFKNIEQMFLRDEVMYQTIQIKNEIIEFVRYLMGNRYK